MQAGSGVATTSLLRATSSAGNEFATQWIYLSRTAKVRRANDVYSKERP